MRRFALALLLFTSLPMAHGAWDDFSSELRQVRTALREKQAALAALETPMIGNTVPEFGFQHNMRPSPPPVPPYVQVDLGQVRNFDTVVLVPAVVDFQNVTQKPYAFPPRFRVDASNDSQFTEFTPLLVREDADIEKDHVDPVVIHAPSGSHARYLRLTVTRMAQEEGYWTFALAEFMVLDGNRNIAIGVPLSHKGSNEIPRRWSVQNLTDGRTPLGPPIERSQLPKLDDGLFASLRRGVAQPWLGVDLGQEMPLDEVRLHPLHARQGADVPGYAFPARFRVETARKEDFSDATPIFQTGNQDISNPGNNPVTIPAKGATARYARVMMLPEARAQYFALSEMEVYSGGKNVSRGMKALSSGDSRGRPYSLLTDGYTSFGRLIELPEWVGRWEQRRALTEAMATLSKQERALSETAQRRLQWMIGGAALLIGLGVAGLFWRTHRRSARAQEQFRAQLARDMHDEIGSNLAGIAVISETAATEHDKTSEDWQTINRIALETGDAMREVLWLVGARQESGIDLMEHLQRVAARLLPKQEIQWLAVANDLPGTWPMEARRQVFLFFKEALTNITRHARATRVELSAMIRDGEFELVIRDNGSGFDPSRGSSGIGLASLRERARILGGNVAIDSSPGKGAIITLRAPLAR